ncbi:MAG: hypothetical protein P8N76_14945 [Pirellulaceae bacterium]|nr:hypothetical protein [Pirellulaceae bacterium]
MAKCDEGYLCDVCGDDVSQVTDSQLYLLFVIGDIDPELLHTSQERHLRCNPILAQFIVDAEFPSIFVEGDFDKRQLDPAFVEQREQLVSRGWRRLREISGQELAIIDYPLPEVIEKLKREAQQ